MSRRVTRWDSVAMWLRSSFPGFENRGETMVKTISLYFRLRVKSKRRLFQFIRDFHRLTDFFHRCLG
jgi:hypothetical protein